MRDKAYNLMVYLLGSLMLLFVVLPVFILGSRISLTSFLKQVLSPEVLRAGGVSFLAATITLIISSAFGVPLAYILARRNFPGKWLINILVVMPLVMPPVVSGILLLMVYGPYTFIGSVAARGGLGLTGSLWGIILAQTFIASPYLIISAKSAFEAVDEKLERVSLGLGKSYWQTFSRVTLPLAKNGIIAGMILTWARALGEFGATMVIAYHPYSLPVKIWVDFIGKGLEPTFPIIVLLLIIGFLLFLTIKLLGREVKLNA
jgi:molybdate/tungstate transport system permease protein